MTQQLHVAGLPQAIEDGYFDTANANKSSVRVHGGQSSEFPIYPTTLERTIRPDARQPDGSRSLSARHIAKRSETGNPSSRSMPPKRTACYQQREWQQSCAFSRRHTTMHM